MTVNTHCPRQALAARRSRIIRMLGRAGEPILSNPEMGGVCHPPRGFCAALCRIKRQSLTRSPLTHCKRLCLPTLSLTSSISIADSRHCTIHPSILPLIIPGTASPTQHSTISPRAGQLYVLQCSVLFFEKSRAGLDTRSLCLSVCLSIWPYSLTHSLTHDHSPTASWFGRT